MARMIASFAATTSPNETVAGSDARSLAKSDRWSRAQIRKKPSEEVTRCIPRSLPGSSAFVICSPEGRLSEIDCLVETGLIARPPDHEAMREQSAGDKRVA